MTNSVQRRSAPEFAKELDKIKVERIKRNIDIRPIADVRITRGIVKLPEWPTMRDRLINMPRNPAMDKKRK